METFRWKAWREGFDGGTLRSPVAAFDGRPRGEGFKGGDYQGGASMEGLDGSALTKGISKGVRWTASIDGSRKIIWRDFQRRALLEALPKEALMEAARWKASMAAP